MSISAEIQYSHSVPAASRRLAAERLGIDAAHPTSAQLSRAAGRRQDAAPPFGVTSVGPAPTRAPGRAPTFARRALTVGPAAGTTCCSRAAARRVDDAVDPDSRRHRMSFLFLFDGPRRDRSGRRFVVEQSHALAFYPSGSCRPATRTELRGLFRSCASQTSPPNCGL